MEGNESYKKYDNMTLAELGRAMEEVRATLDEVTECKSALEKEYDFIRSVKIPPAMEASGFTSFRLDSGKGIRVQDEVFVSVPAADFDDFKNWLIEAGEAGIIKETVHPSTLKSFITKRIKDGKEYPAEVVKVTIVPKARFY
jgi:hypothetical protein